MFCALFFGGHRTWPGSHCRSEIPQIYGISLPQRDPPRAGLPWELSRRDSSDPCWGPTEIDLGSYRDRFWGVAFCTGFFRKAIQLLVQNRVQNVAFWTGFIAKRGKYSFTTGFGTEHGAGPMLR